MDEDTAYAVPGLSNMPPLAPGTSSNTDPPTNTDAGNGTLEAGEEDPRTLFINSLLLPLQENLTRTPSRGSHSLIPRRTRRHSVIPIRRSKPRAF